MRCAGLAFAKGWGEGGKICRDNVRQVDYHPYTDMRTRATRSEKLDFRISPEAKRKLRAGADAKDKSVSDFVLESALEAADAALQEQRLFRLGSKEWERFLAALEAPPRRHPRLERLLREPSILD